MSDHCDVAALMDNICHSCGMPLPHSKEYHPHAACLMFQSCRDSNVVAANILAIIEHTLQNSDLSPNQIMNGMNSYSPICQHGVDTRAQQCKQCNPLAGL